MKLKANKLRGRQMLSFAVRNGLKSALPEPLEHRLLFSNSYQVTSASDNTTDPNLQTLRWAIAQVNADSTDTGTSPDTITFAIGGGGAQTIGLTSPLPQISNPVIIQGISQPGYAGKPLIELNGASAGFGANGLGLVTFNSTINGLSIDQFGGAGVVVTGSNDVIGGSGGANVISGNNLDGVRFTSGSGTGNFVAGNYFGTDPTGNTPLNNTGNGVTIAGGDVTVSGNIIAASTNGVEVDGGSATITNNYIGTNAAGAAGLGNSGNGILVNGASVTLSGNTLADNAGDGLHLDVGSVTATGNYIGSNGTFGGNGVTVSGGTATLTGNTLVGNAGDGLTIFDGTVSATGNYLGTDSAGHTGLGNTGNGATAYGGAVTLSGNAVASNAGDGIDLYDDGATVLGNYIGTDAAQHSGIGNARDGIYIYGNNNTIGGPLSGQANVIADNGVSGVAVFSGTGNIVRGNSIYANDQAYTTGQAAPHGLGIDLDGDGVTANDSQGHVGPNDYQNFPVLSSATLSGGNVTVQGSLVSAAGMYTVDFYANSGPNPTGYGEGETYLGSTQVSITDPSTPSTFTAMVPDTLINEPFITATATDANGNTSEFGQFIQTSGQQNTQNGSATSVASSVNPAVYGQSITFTATVTAQGTPGGNVTFMDGSTPLGIVAIDSSKHAQLIISTLGVGPHNVTAQYAGDPNTAASTSPVLPEQVNQAATTTTLVSSSSSLQYGDTPTLTATVAAQLPGMGTPGGTITFYDGTTPIGAVTLSGGGASIQVPSLSVKSHDFSAVYSGDTDFTASIGALTQNVQAASTSTSVTSAPNPSVFGQAATLTASVSAASSAGTPAGSVTFYDGTTAIGTATLSGGTASVATSALSVGQHAITAQFLANQNFATSVSSSITQVVNKAATTTSLVSATNPSVFGQDVTLTATVATVAPGAGTPTGTVTFSDGSQLLSTVTLTGNTATLDISSLTVATHPITATYNTSDDFLTSTSATLNQIVNQASTSTSLVSSANPSVFGQNVTFTATVAPTAPGAGVPAGTVTFYDGLTSLGTQTLSAGVATLTSAALPVGNHAITATYNGNASFLTSSSAPLAQVVATDATATALAAAPNPSVYGQAVTFTATVTASAPGGGIPTGSVAFKDGTTLIGTAALTGGVATFNTTALGAGDHSITAVYGGDSNYAASNANLTQHVTQAGTTTTLATSASPSVFGQSVTFTAAVASSTPGTPAGTVTFYDGTTVLGAGSLSGGAATFTTSALIVGAHSITAVYGGDANFQTSTSAPLTQQVNQDPTSTVILSSANPSVFGQPVVYTAMVTPAGPGAGTPTGSIVFKDGATTIGTVTLANDTASFTPTGLTIGAHSITAVYSGDGSFGSSNGQLTQTVNQDPTSTGIASSLNPSKYGEVVVFTATISPNAPGAGSPTGAVSFYEGTTLLGTGTVSNSQATFTTPTLSVLSHSIVAQYSGDTQFLPSNSGQLMQQVVQEQTTVSVTSSADPSVFGQSVTFTAAVSANDNSAGVPTGTVTFYDGSTAIGAGSLNGSANASITTSLLGIGNHPITAVYGGDANYVVGTSPSLSQTVNQDATSTTLTSSSNPSVSGQVVTFTASVSPSAPGAGTPTGTVTFKDGSAVLGVQTLAGGTASISISTLTVGGHSITAVYSGDTKFIASTGALTQQVAKDQTTATVASSANPSVFGQQVTLTATVAAAAPGSGTPGGTVTFYDGATSLGSAPLSGGSASMAVSTLSVGTHPITAVYSGDTTFTAVTSAALSQVVGQAATSTAVTSSNNPSVFGQSVTLTANVIVSSPGAGIATGTVTFKDGSTVLGTATLNGGNASLTLSNLVVGGHSITAVYGGSASFSVSTSPTLSQTVNKDAVNVSVGSSLNPSLVGQSVTFTATVGAAAPGAGTPTGTVTFKDGTTTLGTATLASGTATLTTSALAVGSHSITVTYGADGSFAAGTSAALVQTVSTASTTTTLASSANPSVVGQTVTFTATVSVVSPGSGTPTGTVTFKDGSTVLGAGTLSGGVATFSTSALTVGTHSVTASYGSDSNYAASASASLNQVVNQAASTTAVTSSANPAVFGQTVTFTATVSGPSGLGTATGTVTFKDGNTVLGTATLSGGSATLAVSTLTVGTHSITAVYGGNTNLASSTSAPLSQKVNADATVTTVTSSANPSMMCQSVTFTASVAAASPGSGVPTGTVTFYDGSTVLGTATLSSGKATFSTSSLALGGHTITATYQGSVNFTASSGSLAQMVDAPNCGGTGCGESCDRSWWECSSGQGLVKCFNGNSSCTTLGNWLACTFSNLYGAGAGANNLTGKTNAQVCAYFQSLCGQSNQCAAEILCTALNVYATCQSLGGSQGCQYGFRTSSCGLAGATCYVGSNGAAFGESNNCNVNVFKLLHDTNARCSGGVPFGGSSTACGQASAVFGAINHG